jgi:hypothetical protein
LFSSLSLGTFQAGKASISSLSIIVNKLTSCMEMSKLTLYFAEIGIKSTLQSKQGKEAQIIINEMMNND